VACDPATVDPRFLVDEAKLDRLAAVISTAWPEEIAIADIQKASLIRDVEAARLSLLETLDLSGLASS
jgi:succinylarginine dihydrolase